MPQFVISLYKPIEGKEDLLFEAIKEHMPVLLQEELVTDRPAYVMRSKNGIIIEVFEWRSQQAIEMAHKSPAVRKLWDKFSASCTYTTLAKLEEVNMEFPGFETLDIK